MQKKAIEIQTGDYLTPASQELHEFDRAPSYGEVTSTSVIDAGVQISFKDGGYIVRGEGELVEVKAVANIS